MNKKEYAEYEAAVANFFKKEEINNLSGGPIEKTIEICPGCEEEWSEVGHTSFSTNSCECCGSNLAGERYHVTGYHPESKEIYCYDICVDCYYYAEYGQLDDITMMEIEKDEQ